MNVHNPFLETGGDTKGGGLFLGNPAMVQNIPCRTSGAPPTAFEAQLADTLMALFSAGSWELDAILPQLEARGCRDRNGSPWTAATFQSQLEESAARLFAAQSGST